MAAQNAPQPPKRTKFIKVVDNEWKTRLTESFEGFNASQVSQKHLMKANECIDNGGTRDERYRLVPFERILNENQELGKTDYLTSMTSAYDLLLKFVINLLKPNRPPVWRSIKTNNTAFKARVACMKGYEDILKTAGYTEKEENSLQFPEYVQEPDKQKLYVIAAELLMARLEVDRMNPASQSQQQQQVEGSLRQPSPSNQRRVQTAMVGSTTGAGVGSVGVGSGSSLWGGQRQSYDAHQMQQHGYQQQQPYSSRTTMLGGYGAPHSTVPEYQQPSQRELPERHHLGQEHHVGYQPDYQQEYQLGRKHEQRPSYQQNQPTEVPREGLQSQGQEKWQRTQSEEALSSSQPPMNGSVREVATVNMGSPAEVERNRVQQKRKPRVPRTPRKIGPDRSLSQQSSQGSIPSPSSSTSSLSSPTPSTESEDPLSMRKNVCFTIPEAKSEGGGGENDDADDYLKKLRERRMAAKTGDRKNITVADISTEKRSDLSSAAPAPKTYSRTTVHPESERLSQSSPSLSSLRQPLTPARVEPLPPQTSPTPTPSGRSEEESDDSSSDKYSTPPMTVEHVEPVTTGPGHTHQDTPTPTTPGPSDGANEHDPVLEEIRRRRRELKEQREQSGKKKDTSPPTTETKRETETLPPLSPPQLSSGASSSQYSGGDVSRQATSDNNSSSSSIYCPKCYCTVRLGQKYCSYCGEAVYRLFTKAGAGGAGAAGTAASSGATHQGQSKTPSEGVDTSVPSARPQPSGQFRTDPCYLPDPNAPSLPPKPSPRQAKVIAEQNSLYDASGLPKRASVPPEDKLPQQPPPSRHHHTPAVVDVRQQPHQQQPLRARVDDNQPSSGYDQRYDPNARFAHPSGVGETPPPPQGQVDPYSKKAESSQASAAVGGASGFTLSPTGAGIRQYGEKLEKYREFLHKKGKSDTEIDNDPDYLMMVEEVRKKYSQDGGLSYGNAPGYNSTTAGGAPGYGNIPGPANALPVDEYRQKQQAEVSPSKKKPDMSGYRKIDLMATSDGYSSENLQAMDKLKQDGQQLLYWIKKCVPYGYSLDEIQIASDFIHDGRSTKAKNPLEFLDSDWARMTQRVQTWVAGTQTERRPFVGKPTEDETRKALVETKGDDREAVDIIYKERKKKIDSLLKRLAHMRSIQSTIPELSWQSAVDVLSVNGMDVNKACYAVQCEWLQPLYESINSEHKKVKQEEMAEIKTIVSKKDDSFSKEARCRMLMAECEFDDQNRAQMVLELMEEVENDENNYPLHYYVDAAHDFDNLQSASEFLFKECPIQGFCAGDKVPIHEMITMPGCTCSLCKECFKGQFDMVIQEQQVKHFNCPICQKPDMSNKDDIQEMYELLFVNMIKEHLGGKIYELCQEKLKEFNLTKDPDFLWCAHDKCGSGFIYEGDRTRPRDIQCPNCRNFMCWKCKKPWEAQHLGISCEQFAQWKRDNDPEAQELGLAAHLNDNGIECPACHARYELARGGCMHFKCTRCPNEFCSGCGESLKKGKECGKFNSCAGKGLHAHHPRDCLFYLRDLDVKELQDFLKENKMDFNTEAPKEQIEAAKREKKKKREGGEGEEEEGESEDEEGEAEPGGGEEQEEQDDGAVELHCRVEEQKESVDGLKDEVCARIVEKGHAGLCNVHYKEYLVNIINQHGLDPVTIYKTPKILLMLKREEIEEPEQEDDEDDPQYRERLIQHVQENLNLTGGRKAGEAHAQAQTPAPAQGGAAGPAVQQDEAAE